MGVVFAARHLALDERVAIKVLSPAASENQEALARLQREARILARVRNEHVVRVIDLGQLEDGAPFMVMEHLAGRDLGSLLEEQGRLGVQVAVGYVLQALVALAAAHANGVVHRDLKPDNLFCTRARDGAWIIKVLDFGISRLEQLGQSNGLSSMTGPSAIMGTPLYMSPEQLRDARGVDARSDVWSIGVVLYELVTGISPFSGASLGDIAVKIATERPPPLVLVDSSLAPGLEAVLTKCLRKEREQRFANVAELARALQQFGPAGCERLVEQVERLAAEPPIHLAADDKRGLSDADSGPALELATATAVGSPSSAAVARRRARAALLLLALPLPVVLLAWRLVAARDEPSSVPPAPSRLVEARPPVDVLRDGARLAPSVAERELLLVPSEQPAPKPSSGDVAKNPRAASSLRSIPAMKGPCDPPYTVDAQGRKKFRHECFTERTAP